MEIVCESCKAKLNIPDEKLPHGQRVSVRCPRCKNKLVIDTTVEQPDSAALSDPGTGTSEPAPLDTPASPATEEPESPPNGDPFDMDDSDMSGPLDDYGEAEKLALVMVLDTHPSDKIDATLTELGYHTIYAKNTQEAVGKMRLQNFDLVILTDLFDNIPLGRSPVLQYLNQISMSVRRKMFVFLLSDTFRTMDQMMAFAMSANLVMNWKDVERLSNILTKALSDNEKFYKVFMDTLKETGKV